MRSGVRSERLVAFLLAAYAIIAAWDFSTRPACIDYYQFWVVGRAALAGEARDVYSDADRTRLGELYWQRAVADAASRRDPHADSSAPPPLTKRFEAARQRRVLETFSTPWFYTLLGAFSAADYERSQDLFQRASLLAYLAAILVLARILGYSSFAAALWIAALLQVFNPFVDDTIAGNVNRLQILAFAVFLGLEIGALSPLRRAFAGALLGATLAFKPNLAAVAVVLALGWLASGEPRRLVQSSVGFAAGIAGAVLVSSANFGSLAVWSAWLSELPRLMSPGSSSAGDASEGNFSLVRLIQDAAGMGIGTVMTAALFAGVIVSLALERRRRRSDARGSAGTTSGVPRDVLLLGLGTAASLLASELAWQHYFLAVIPLAMFLLRPRNEGEPVRATARAAAAAGLAMVSLQSVGRLFDLHRPAAGAAVVAGGTLLLFLLGLADLAGRRAPDASAS